MSTKVMMMFFSVMSEVVISGSSAMTFMMISISKPKKSVSAFFEEASTYHENDVSCEDSDHEQRHVDYGGSTPTEIVDNFLY